MIGHRPAFGFTLCNLVGAAALLCGSTTSATAQQPDAARDLAIAALDAMGGVALWRNLTGLELETIGHSLWLEQSERPEGPWLVGYEQVTLSVDFAGDRVRRVAESRDFQNPDWRPLTTLLDGDVAAMEVRGRIMLAPSVQEEELREIRAVLPDRALLGAVDAADLRLEANVDLQGVPHRVIAYDLQDLPIRIFLNQHTGLPTAVQTLRSEDDVYTVVWGDSPKTYYFSLWSLEPGGYIFPRQWDVEEIGQLRTSATVTSIAFAPEFDVGAMQIPDSVKQAPSPLADWSFRNFQLGEQRGQTVPAVEVAAGLVTLAGAWNTALVAQDDGVLVIEAPISSEYSQQILDEAKRRFPELPVKAVITTSDAWPHVSGVREYVGRGIPVYALDINAELLRRLAASDHRRVPDLQMERRGTPDIREISGPVGIGSGRNRIDVYPVRGEGGERMLVLYFPAHRALYASDLVQRGRDGRYFMPEYLVEVANVVRDHRLDVDVVFAMHTEPTPWADVLAAIAEAGWVTVD